MVMRRRSLVLSINNKKHCPDVPLKVSRPGLKCNTIVNFIWVDQTQLGQYVDELVIHEIRKNTLIHVFRRTTRAFKQHHFLCYILYEQWRFHYSMLQVIVKSTLDLDVLDRASSFDNPSTCSTHWRQWRGWYTLFRHGLHGAVGMVFYAHVVYVTCYFCYMFSLGSSSGSTCP